MKIVTVHPVSKLLRTEVFPQNMCKLVYQHPLLRFCTRSFGKLPKELVQNVSLWDRVEKHYGWKRARHCDLVANGRSQTNSPLPKRVGTWVGISNAKALEIVWRDRTSKNSKQKFQAKMPHHYNFVCLCSQRFTAIVLPRHFLFLDWRIDWILFLQTIPSAIAVVIRTQLPARFGIGKLRLFLCVRNTCTAASPTVQQKGAEPYLQLHHLGQSKTQTLALALTWSLTCCRSARRSASPSAFDSWSMSAAVCIDLMEWMGDWIELWNPRVWWWKPSTNTTAKSRYSPGYSPTLFLG